MKSIICSFLLLISFCLVPFVAFSSTFTSNYNPIVLPTTTHDLILPEVLDTDGQPLKIGEEYTIFSAFTGAGGVYLDTIGGTRCPYAVLMHILYGENAEEATPVKFFPKQESAGVVREMDDINIMFTGPTIPWPCVNETVWKVSGGQYPRDVMTGGTLGIGNWFKIEKFITAPDHHAYKFRYCPSQSMCPNCVIDCSDVGVTVIGRYRHLVLNNKPYPFRFVKVKVA